MKDKNISLVVEDERNVAIFFSFHMIKLVIAAVKDTTQHTQN